MSLSPSRSFTKITTTLAGFVALTAAACGAAPEGGTESTATESSTEALVSTCPMGYTHTCTDEGVGGSMVCSPCTPAGRLYFDDAQGGAAANYDKLLYGRSSSALYNLGCTYPTLSHGIPFFACPVGVSLPAGVTYYGLPECPVVNGIASHPSSGSCETLWSNTVPAQSRWIQSDVTPLAPQYEYVWITTSTAGNEGINGKGCSASCADIPH